MSPLWAIAGGSCARIHRWEDDRVPRHVVLVGLPGSGKTVAGQLAAQKLGAPFVDLDQVMVTETGKSVAELFASDGEAHFRVLERKAMTRVLSQPARVIASGGGWAAQPGNLESGAANALLVYLRVTPGIAADRLKDDVSRPLLSGEDPVKRLTQLLDNREPFYRQAGHSIDTDGRTPDAVADVIASLARRKGGWGTE
jgi:shikimate kinase